MQPFITPMRTREDVVKTLVDLVELHGADLKSLSLKLDRNHAYLQQFVREGTPRHLSEETRLILAKELGTTEEVFKWGPTSDTTLINKYKKSPATTAGNSAKKHAIVHEVDARGGAGGGGQLVTEQQAILNEDNGQLEGGDGIIGSWAMPWDFVRSELRIDPDHARIISILGNSMEPTLKNGDRVLVDTNDKVPSPPGIFALWDGYGIVVKSVEHIHNSDPPAIRIISDNTTFSPYELVEDEANIIGRVRWCARAL